MNTTINIKNITKIKYIPFDKSKNFVWLNNPKGFIFRKPSGVYYCKNGTPIICCGVVADNYESACELLPSNKYRISQNEDGSLVIFEKSHIEIHYAGCEDPDYYYYDDPEDAQNTYFNIVHCMESFIEI